MSGDDLPLDVYVKILKHLGREDFRTFGGLMVMSKTAMQAIESSHVLKSANIDEFLLHGEMVCKTSPYRAIFMKCLNEGNPLAYLMEGLRIAYNEGDVFGALAMVEQSPTPYCRYTMYTRAMLMINAGDFFGAIRILYRRGEMWDEEDIARLNEVGDSVIEAIKAMDPPKKQTFMDTYQCPFHADCSCSIAGKKNCILCFPWFHSARMLAYS